MGTQRRAYFYAIAAVLLWSTVASAFKISLRHIQVLPLLFCASLTSTAVLFCILSAGRKLNSLKILTRRECLNSALLGFLNPFLYYIVLFNAYSRLPAQTAQPLNFTWPIMLVLLSVPLLHQRIKFTSIFAILISFAGVYVIATRGDVLGFRFTDTPGVLLALGSSLIWALFWIYNLRDTRDEILKLFLNFAFGSLFTLVSLVLFSDAPAPNFKEILGSVYVGLFEMGITFLFWMRALRLSKTTAPVANLIYLVPFISVVIIHFAVGEEIFLSTLIGLALIVTGIVLQKL